MGFAGAGHCVGMCGGFVLAVGRGAAGVPALAGRHLAYHAGKTLTYVFLAVLVSAGFGVVGRASWSSAGQTTLAAVAGIIMIAYGAGQALEIHPALWWKRFVEPLPACRSLGAVASSRSSVSAFATGWLNGFLPCGLPAGRPPVSGKFTECVRRRLTKLAGVFLIVFGILTIVRAFPEGRHWLHEQLIPSVAGTIRDWCGF